MGRVGVAFQQIASIQMLKRKLFFFCPSKNCNEESLACSEAWIFKNISFGFDFL
jgi:hypothetical protein